MCCERSPHIERGNSKTLRVRQLEGQKGLWELWEMVTSAAPDGGWGGGGVVLPYTD